MPDVKVWHDDIRIPPEGYEWARTNAEAQAFLETGEVEEIDLDHDMGLHYIDPWAIPEAMNLRGRDPATGYDLVCWMIEHDLVPEVVKIHSWNADGAKRMYLKLNEHGYDCEYEAYTP